MKHTRFAIVLLIIVVSLIGILSAKPETLVRSEIPDEYKWDLTDIYADWDAWETDFTELKETMDEYAAFKGRLAEGSDVLLKAFKLGDKLGMLADGVYSYVSMSRDTDTRDNEISGKLQRVQILFSQFGTATAWFDPEMLNIPWETMEAWLSSGFGSEIELVICNNDGMAFGAVQAMTSAGVDLPVYGVDALAQALTMIGDDELNGTVLNDGVNQARATIDLAINAANGDDIVAGTDWVIDSATGTKAVRVSYVAVTKDNYSDFQ